jgi:hypothetical protein
MSALGRQAVGVVAAMDARWPPDGRVAVSNGSFRPKHVLALVEGRARATAFVGRARTLLEAT